jgi:hypothetical protein
MVHSDGSYCGIDIGDGTHIASPVDKLIAGIRDRHQDNSLTLLRAIGEPTFSRLGYITTLRTIDS